MIYIQKKEESSDVLQEEIYAFPDAEALPLRIVMAGITYPDPNYRIERKKSRNRIFVFEYVMEGRGHLLIDGTRYSVCAGDTYLLTPNTEQCYYADKNEPFKKIWINIESTYLDALLRAHGLSHGVYRYNSLPQIKEMLSAAKRAESTAAASMEIAPLLLALIESLSEKYEKHENESPALTARERIDALGAMPFSPNALASELHVSLSTLTRIFRSAYGYTPYEYYLLRKETMAKSLLQNTGLSAKEIAYRLGFSDEHYFSNFFKKRTGLRPLEYRKGRDFGK